MRKCYFIAVLVCSTSLLSAQVKKGSILLGGQLYYSTGTTESGDFKTKSSGGSIGVSIGKAIKENTVAGLNLSFSPRKEVNVIKWPDTANVSIHNSNYGVFIRQYKQVAKGLFLFGEAEAGYTRATQTEEYKNITGDVSYKQQAVYISLAPGLAYQLLKKMQVELMLSNLLSLRYLVTETESDITQVTNTKRKEFSFYSNLNSNSSLGGLAIGFRFLL
jgi:hypothetical protein